MQFYGARCKLSQTLFYEMRLGGRHACQYLMGGLGIRSLTDVALPAYLGSSFSCDAQVSDILPDFMGGMDDDRRLAAYEQWKDVSVVSLSFLKTRAGRDRGACLLSKEPTLKKIGVSNDTPA